MTKFYQHGYKWRPVFIPNEQFNAFRNHLQRPRFFQDGRYGEDLQHLPSGTQALGGVVWHIEQDNHTYQPNVITLKGGHSETEQSEVLGIPIGRTADVVSFLHTGWVEWNSRQQLRQGAEIEVAEYIIHYTDGTSETVPVVMGRNIGNWKNPGKHLPEAKLAYALHVESYGKFAGYSALYRFDWKNPHPDREIKAVDFVRTGEPWKVTPALFAISTGTAL